MTTGLSSSLVSTRVCRKSDNGGVDIRRYFTQVRAEMRAAKTDRDSAVWQRLVPLSMMLSAIVAIYIVLAIVLVPSAYSRDFNFVDERGAITALSAIFLAMSCGFGFATFVLSLGEARTVRCFWLLVSFALGFLALDELLQFHERIGTQLDRLDLMGLTSSGAIRGWNDVVVIMYGVVSVPVGVILLPTIVRYPTFLKVICVAFTFYVLHTAIDSLTEPRTTLSVILEESAKLYCSMSLALACLSGLLTHADAGDERTLGK